MSTVTSVASPVAVRRAASAVPNRPRLRRRTGAQVLVTAAACATVATAPVEGYLLMLHPQLAKLPAVVLVLVWGAVRVRGRVSPALHPVHVLLAGLATVVLVSTAVHLTEPFAVEYAVRWLPFIVVCGVLIDVVATDCGAYPLLVSALAGATVAAGGALFSVLASGDLRASGPLEDPNDLAYVLIAALPLIVAFAPRSRIWQVGLVAAAALLILGAAATLSRGGVIAAAAALAWIVVRRAISPRVLAGAAGMVAVGGAIVAVAAGPLLVKALTQKQFIADANIDSRLLRWEAAARMLAENPLLGVGPGGFRSEYAAASNLAEIAEQTPVTHNMYLEVGAELGLLGLILFLAVIATAFVSSERALRAGAERRVVVAIQASLLAVVVASVFLSEEYYMSLWAMVAIACGLQIRTRRGSGT